MNAFLLAPVGITTGGSIPIIAIAVLGLIFAATRFGVLPVVLIAMAGTLIGFVASLTTIGLQIVGAVNQAATSIGGG